MELENTPAAPSQAPTGNGGQGDAVGTPPAAPASEAQGATPSTPTPQGDKPQGSSASPDGKSSPAPAFNSSLLGDGQPQGDGTTPAKPGESEAQDWHASLPEDLRVSPHLKDVKDVAELARVVHDQREAWGSPVSKAEDLALNLPEGMEADALALESFKQFAVAENLPSGLVQKLAEWQMRADTESWNAQMDVCREELRKAWPGKTYEENAAKSFAGMEKLEAKFPGISQALSSSRAFLSPALHKMLAWFEGATNEASFGGGDDSPAGDEKPMTNEQWVTSALKKAALSDT
ncbi:hypothetical protein dsx2_2639 [Desulfovibrio sp. X2]|uniref:hypothetical protein n=1 Tax=Desulfovibrio sp. X2 TaxID=941449 RepID=UPI000358951B|nr:hypothetical protein [Desulfovibrio sp. X2]EPR42722.1 hypothetical protein dsx2_2639 [Desulfovibrio sp. X2]